MASLQMEDFDIGAQIRLLLEKDNKTGAVVSFLGVARDFSRGKDIVKLEFEHYAGMAESELDSLEKTARKQFDILNIHIIHRVGQIGINENIVLIIVTSMHRKVAFEACEWAIDELKKRVPIWKKEFTTTGETWVEETP